jgi:hypothetical protein
MSDKENIESIERKEDKNIESIEKKQPGNTEILDESSLYLKRKIKKKDRFILEEFENELNEKQKKALEKFLKYGDIPDTKEKIAKFFGIARSTLYNWEKDGLFWEALDRTCKALYGYSVIRGYKPIAEKAEQGNLNAHRYLREAFGFASQAKNSRNNQVNLQINIGNVE